MPSQDSDTTPSTPPYIRPDELTLSLEGPLTDLLITEANLSQKPAINAEPDPQAEQITIHLPFFIQNIDSNAEELAFSENFVHTPLDIEKAKALRDQLTTAIETVENK